MGPVLRVRLLGGLELCLDGRPLPPVESTRAEALLAFLLLHGQAAQPRQRLAFALWPDSTEAQARTNLRHVLHNLRRALPQLDRFLEVTPRTLRWRAEATGWLDVTAFEAALARADQEEDGGRAALPEAVALYRGDLLEGRHDEWLLGERERLRQRFLGALERLTALLEARGEVAEAIGYAERLLREDPLREDAYRRLMRLHDARGDRARALRTYHACAATLERELGVAPSAPTRELYEGLLPTGAEPQTGPVGSLGGPPLAGRASEWARLTTVWRAAEGGGARLLLVTGEPGIGKTRLVEELASWCAHRGAATAEARSYAAEGALAYGPVVAWLRSAALVGSLDRLDRPRLAELARLLPELRSAVPGLPPPQRLGDDDQRQVLFDALARAILAPGGPLLLVADDLHWADRETLRFLHYLLRVGPDAPLLVAATARRELAGRHPLNDLVAGLRGLERLVEVELGRLSREETSALAERFAGRPLGEPAAERLFAEAEGNPLFVVEALRAGWSSGERRLSPKVQAVIESRLASLTGPARDLVGVAATIGRAFTSDVLAAACDLDRAGAGRWPGRAVAPPHRAGPGRRRRRLHPRPRPGGRLPDAESGPPPPHPPAGGAGAGGVARLRPGAGGRTGRRPPRARRRARRRRRLVPARRRRRPAAARQRRRRPPAGTRPGPAGGAAADPRAPGLGARRPHRAAGAAGRALEGWASDRLATAQRRGLELADRLQVEPGPPLLRSIAVASLTRADFEGARRVAEGLRAGGERDADDVRVVESEYVLGIAAFWTGEFAAAERHFRAAVARYRPEHRPTHLARYGLDPEVVCTSRLGNTLWFLGRPAPAALARDRALALAAEVGHPHSHHTALVFAALLALELGETQRIREYAAALAERSAQLWRPTQVSAEAIGGYLDVLDGHRQAGSARLWRALDDPAEAEHAPGLHASVARLLLAACAAAGDPRAGLAAADRALGLGDHARTWEAETCRLRGQFLAELGAPAAEVDAQLERALRLARRQGAKMLELRAATSLLRHRLDADHRRVGQAQTQLASVVAELGGAAGTQDLRAASTLLTRA